MSETPGPVEPDDTIDTARPEFTDNSTRPEDGAQVDADGDDLVQTPDSAYGDDGKPVRA